MKKIAVLCSGGDSQGMNTCLQTIVNICIFQNKEVYGVKYGYKGLINNDFVKLTLDDVKNIGNLGGCFLKTSRCKEFKEDCYVKQGYENLIKNNIDYLIVIGGDGTFRGANELKEKGAKIICIPATIDNDLSYTERTLGFDTAVNNAVKAIDNIRQSLEANDRGMVFEVMGRECGDIALNTALSVGAHSVAIKEIPRTINEVVNDVKKCLQYGIKSPIVILSEGNSFHANEVKDIIEKQLNLETRDCVIGYLQRGGSPSILDRAFATQLGINAIELLNNNIYNVALGLNDFEIFNIKIEEVFTCERKVNKNLYNNLRKLYNL